MIQEKTFKEVLEDTIRFYGEDTSKRSDCCYEQGDGRRCAVGRIIRPGQEESFRRFDSDGNSGTVEEVVHAHQKKEAIAGRTIDENAAVRELTIVLDGTLQDLNFLQILHDEDVNWDSGGLSKFGHETVRAFRPDIAEEVLAAISQETFSVA